MTTSMKKLIISAVLATAMATQFENAQMALAASAEGKNCVLAVNFGAP